MIPALTSAGCGPLAERERRIPDSSAVQFAPLALDNCCTQPDHFANPDATPNRFYAYGVVARLAALAAAIELEETAPAA
jgi:glutamate--cysteine ligase